MIETFAKWFFGPTIWEQALFICLVCFGMALFAGGVMVLHVFDFHFKDGEWRKRE